MTSINHQRRKQYRIGLAVATALTVYGTYHLAVWAWNACVVVPDDDENTATQQNAEAATARQPSEPVRLHRLRMSRFRQEASSTLRAFGVTLARAIEASTDVSVSSKALKELRKERPKDRKKEGELWMTLQVETISRLVATAYAHTMFFAIHTVQVYLTAGHLHRRWQEADSAEHRQALLLIYDAFWKRGALADLVVCVREAVATAVTDWSIHTPATALHMTADLFANAMHSIRGAVEAQSNMLQRFVVVADADSKLLAETFDLLESPVVHDAMHECLDSTFGILLQRIVNLVFVDGDRPLAYVISQMKNVTNDVYTDPSYLVAMEQLPSVIKVALISFGE